MNYLHQNTNEEIKVTRPRAQSDFLIETSTMMDFFQLKPIGDQQIGGCWPDKISEEIEMDTESQSREILDLLETPLEDQTIENNENASECSHCHESEKDIGLDSTLSFSMASDGQSMCLFDSDDELDTFQTLASKPSPCLREIKVSTTSKTIKKALKFNGSLKSTQKKVTVQSTGKKQTKLAASQEKNEKYYKQFDYFFKRSAFRIMTEFYKEKFSAWIEEKHVQHSCKFGMIDTSAAQMDSLMTQFISETFGTEANSCLINGLIQTVFSHRYSKGDKFIREKL